MFCGICGFIIGTIEFKSTLLQVHHWHSLAHVLLAHSSASHHHHHLQILHHLKGVHLLGIRSLSRFVQILVLEFRDVQIHIDLVLYEQSLDCFGGRGAHQTGHCRVLRLVVDKTHQSLVFHVLRVLYHARGNFSEDLKGLFQLLFCSSLF